MPWTFYLRLLHGGPAHKPLVVYRCTAGTPQKPNLLSRDKANSAEESAMRTAVSKAITREQEHSLPTSSSCFPSPIDVTFQQLEQDVLIKVTVAVKRREREWKEITETRQMFFLITKESKCMTDALLLIITIFCAPWQALQIWSYPTLKKSNVISIVWANAFFFSPPLWFSQTSISIRSAKFKCRQSGRNEMCTGSFSYGNPKPNLMPVIFFKTNILQIHSPPL